MAKVINLREQVIFCEGEWYMLSNFSAFSVQYYDFLWPTVEHAYQAQKFIPGINLGQRAALHSIRTNEDPKEAKHVAEIFRHLVPSDWDYRKVSIMRELLLCKVKQNSYVKEKLLETEDKLIIESSLTDSFWGRGPNGEGKNMLGKLWMEIRAGLKKA